MIVENADPLHKVTIIPRGLSLGSTWMLPDEDMIHQSKLKILDQICIYMGGRVAEEIIFGDVSTGASQDISSSTDLARKMVTQWGMSDLLGTITYGQKDEPIFIGKEIAQHKDYSEKTAETIDSEIKKIITEQHDRCKKILNDNIDKLKLLAETLFEKETMDAEEVYALLGMKQEVNDYFKVDKSIEEQENLDDANKK
jgi:cell division protease FtsH